MEIDVSKRTENMSEKERKTDLGDLGGKQDLLGDPAHEGCCIRADYECGDRHEQSETARAILV